MLKFKKETKLYFYSIPTYCMELGHPPFMIVLFTLLCLSFVCNDVVFQYVFIITYTVISLKILSQITIFNFKSENYINFVNSSTLTKAHSIDICLWCRIQCNFFV